MARISFALVLSLSFLLPLAGADLVWRSLVPDNSMVRKSTAAQGEYPFEELAALKPQTHGDPVLVHPVRRESIRNKDGSLSVWYRNVVGGKVRQASHGAVEIVRWKGRPDIGAIRMYPDPAGQVTILVEVQSTQSVLVSVSLLGGAYTPVSKVRFAIPMSSVALMPVWRLIEITAGRIDWTSLMWTRNYRAFDPVVAVASAIRAALPGLRDGEDGAMNADGDLVLITTGLPTPLAGFNCSGFAKWIVDGYYHSLYLSGRVTGTPYLDIDALKARQLALRGTPRTQAWEIERDPFFGLDWTRSLAVSLARARGERAPDPESRDLRSGTFSSYVEDKGFIMTDVPLIMYTEAVKNPGRWYLISVNGEWGTEPTMWQHYHIVAVFPWFDAGGTFHMEVFERNVESSWDSVLKRYPKTWGQVVWLEAGGEFTAPHI